LVEVYKKLIADGPQLGRPLADVIHSSRVHNLKELRIKGTQGSELRILFAFDPKRQAVLLVGGDKKGEWNKWYRRQILLAEVRFLEHLKQLGKLGI
jgi:hypothetical protein